MKKFLLWAILAIILPSVFVACEDTSKKEEDETKNYWEEYANWRNDNLAFFEEKYAEVDSVGALVYDRVTPTWDAGSTILMRWYNPHQSSPSPQVPVSETI